MSDIIFALSIFGFVFWTAVLTQLLPRALAYGVAFAANRTLPRAQLSIGALYLYPLAGRFVVQRILYVDSDVAASLAELVVVWRWWRRGRLITFEDNVDEASATDPDERPSNSNGWVRKLLGAILGVAANPVRRTALLSITCTGLRVRAVNMRANYVLLGKLRDFVSGEADIEPFEPGAGAAALGRKTSLDHILEYTSLKVNKGALYCCDPGASPLMLASFDTAKVRYKHGRARSPHDLFRYSLHLRLTQLRVSVADLKTLTEAGVKDPQEVLQSVPEADDKGSSYFTRFCARPSARFPFGLSQARSRPKEELECCDVVRAREATAVYVVDEAGPVVPLSNSEDDLPPELKCSVELRGASIVYYQNSVSALQDIQERIFPRLFDLTRVAEEFQARLNRRMPKSFILDITAYAETEDIDGEPPPPLIRAPFKPRVGTWRSLELLGVNRGRNNEDVSENENKEEQPWQPPETQFAITSEKVAVNVIIPYKMGDPLNVKATVPWLELALNGVANFPICVADALEVTHCINFPKVWNDLHKARLVCTIINGEITYMADLIRAIDDIGFQIDAHFRKPEDVRYFVPNESTIVLKAVQGFSVRLAASRGNAWADVYKGITDEFGMAVLKGEGAELTVNLDAGTTYLPSVVHVHWSLFVPRPSLYLALPCPQPAVDPYAMSDAGEQDQHTTETTKNSAGDGRTFAERVRALVDETGDNTEDATSSTNQASRASTHKRSKQSYEMLESEHVLLQIAEVGGNVDVEGRAKTHTELFADGVNENTILVRINGIVLDTNPHHFQHYLNIIANLTAFVNHMLTAEEKQRLDQRRRSLAFSIVEDRRVPSFEECVLLGSEGGISLATAAHHAGEKSPVPPAMDDFVNITLEVDGGVLMLHNLPNSLCSFTSHPSQVCSLDLGKVCFALTGNQKEVVSRFAPVPDNAEFKLYAGQPKELRTSVMRRAQNKPIRESSLHRYPQITISDFLLTRQVLVNKKLGAYHAFLDVSVGKVSGCIQEVTAIAVAGFAKSINVRPPYEEAPVIEALVGIQTNQVRIGRTDILVLCGSQALTFEERALRTISTGSLTSSPSQTKQRKVARVYVGFLPSQVASIAQLRLRDGMRFCMANVASDEFLSKMAVTVPDLSVQLFTPWGGTSTRWIDEATLRAQVSHSSAIKAWRQVGIQAGRPVMHKAGVFENFVLHAVWESHPSLWSDTVHVLQRQRLENADRLTRHIPTLWEAAPWGGVNDARQPKPSVLDTYNAKWWEFLDLVDRRKRVPSNNHQSGMALSSIRRDVVSLFILSHITLSIGPEALELANYIASEIRSSTEGRNGLGSPGDLIELWRDLAALCSQQEDIVRSRDEDRPSRVLGTTLHCNIHVTGASIVLICPFLAEDTMDRSRAQPVVVRDERVSAAFPNGIQMSYRWRSQRGATGSPVSDVSTSPNLPSYSFLLRQSAVLQIPLIEMQTSDRTVASITEIRGRLSDSITFRRKRRIGLDVSEETHRGNHRSFDFSVAAVNCGTLASDLETLSELGRVFSIYGLMLRAVGLDLEATFRWYQERRNAACNAVFAVPFEILCKLPAEDIRLICFGRQSRFLRSQRYVPKFNGSDVVENAFFAADDLENKLAGVGRQARQSIAGSFDFGPNSFASKSVSVTARIDEILVAVCEREALAICGFEAEAQFEVVHDARFAVQEPPVARIGIASVNFSIRDDVAELGMRTVSTVASYIRFAAAYIPMLSYEVIVCESDDNGPISSPRGKKHATKKQAKSSETAAVVTKGRNEDANDTPKRSRYNVRTTGRFRLRRHAPESTQDNGTSGWSSRARRRRSIDDSPRGLTPVHSPSGLGSAPTPNEETRTRPSTPRRPRITRGESSGNYATPTHSPKLTPQSTPAQTPTRTPASTPESKPQLGQSAPNVSGLKDVLHIYKPPRVKEVASARIHGRKGFVVRSIDRTSGLDEEAISNTRPNSPDSVRRSSSGGKSSMRKRSSSGRGAEQGSILPSNSGQQSFQSSTAATIICSVNDVNVTYFRSETRDLFADGPAETTLVPDLAIHVSELRASGVVTPLSLCQSFVVTVDDASLRSGDDNANCVLEGSLASIVGMVSVSSGTLPSDPKRVVASTRVSDFQLSLRARDLRSVQSFAEKFKKDVSSLALSSLATRKSLAAMMRATKLENLTRTSAPRVSFATLAGDVSVEKFKTSLLGFHPGDKEMQIAYEVESMFGSLAALEDSNVTLTVGGLIYGHGLVLSSPSWSGSEQRIGFPTLDIRGVQWAHTTELPTQINVITGPLVTSASFQGLRNVLYTVSGLLAFQNQTPFDLDTFDESSTSSMMGEKKTCNDLYSAGSSVSDTAYARTPQQSAALNRSLMTWERTKAVRLEFALKPMSIGLFSGGVMAAFDSESISGTVEWNKQVTHGNQLQAVTQIPQITLKYSRVDQSALSSDEVLSEDISLLVATKDIRLDLLKSQYALNHNFVFRLKVRSINGHLRPWRLVSAAAVWANEQDAVVKEFQAVNSDAAALARNISRSNSAFANQHYRTEHRIITVGADINQASLAVPLLDSEDSENYRLRITASDVRYSMRLGNKFALPARTNLAQLKSHYFGVLWEDNPFIHAQEFQVMFAIGAASGQKKAHIGALRGRCSTKSWTVCPRKDIVLAFIDAKSAPENRLPRLATGQQQPFAESRRKITSLPISSTPTVRYKLFESAEFMLLPSRGYIRGLDNKEHFSAKTSSFVDKSDTSNSEHAASELSIPTFKIAWLRSSDFDFDLFDVDFSGKDDEFPQGILRKAGNIFSELFGAVATNSAAESTGDLPGFANRPKPRREVMREWSALFRFGKSRYVARENVTGKLGTRFEFFAENHAGFLASVSASGGDEPGVIENSTVVTGIAPLLSLKIKPDLEKAMTQGLELNSVRFLQGYAPGSAPHTCVHVKRVHASLDVMTSLLVREWLKRDQTISTVGRDTSSEGSSLGANRNSAPWDSNSIVVLGQPARISREKPVRKSPDAAVRIMLQLSQPDGRVGLLIQRIHCGFAVQRLRSASIGYSTDMHIGVHQIESRADWEYLSCSFKLSRLLLRFEGERAMQEENICGFAGIVNLFSFDFKRGENDALQLKVEGVAGACRVPECDLAVQTTTVDASVSSSTANSLQRLLQLATRLAREAKRQIESIAITDARLHDIAFGDSSAPPLDMLLPRSRGDARTMRTRGRTIPVGGRIRDESGRIMRAFTSASASLSGDRLIINLHGYKFQDASGAQFKFVEYEVQYKEQSGASYGSRGSDSAGSSHNPAASSAGARSVLTRRQLRVTFKLLEMGHFAADSSVSTSVISMPNPNLDFTVVETGDTATVDLFTKFDREIVISSMVSQYDYLVNILKMYGESRVQVRSMFEQLEEPTPPPTEVNAFRPFGGRNVELKRFILSPKLQPLGELTPDLNILQRVGLGRKEQIPAYMYDFVMLPVAKALQAATKPLL